MLTFNTSLQNIKYNHQVCTKIFENELYMYVSKYS